MISLKEALAALYLDRTGRHLIYQSMARFDQQITTKFHLDGAPPESFLMLGYEPSDVPSTLAMADYTCVARNLGIDPAEFISDHNPMYFSGAKLLEGAITPIEVFDPTLANVLVVNNSCLPLDERGRNLLGVMHQATIPQPDLSKRRIINSTMLRTAADRADETPTPEQQAGFITTTHISEPVSY